MLAAKAGIPVSPLPLSDPPPDGGERCTVMVFEDCMFGDAGADPFVDVLAEPCVRLARLAGLDLLGVELRLDEEGRSRFAGVTPMPNLRIGGSALIERLYGRFAGLTASTP